MKYIIGDKVFIKSKSKFGEIINQTHSREYTGRNVYLINIDDMETEIAEDKDLRLEGTINQEGWFSKRVWNLK